MSNINEAEAIPNKKKMRCIVIASSDLELFSRIQEKVEVLVASNGGANYSSTSSLRLSDLDVESKLAQCPILSITSTEHGTPDNFLGGTSAVQAQVEDLRRENDNLAESFFCARKELKKMTLSLRKLIWQWIPEHTSHFNELRARNYVNVQPISIGSSFGEYTLLDQIGQGATAVVFSCLKKRDNREICLKMMDKSELLTIKALARFSAELSILRHPDGLHKNILPILEVVHSTSHISYAMELFGQNLIDFSETHDEDIHMRRANTQTAIEAISEALLYVHNRGFVHRDIKSENILVRTQPCNNNRITDVRLIDFGISCHIDDDEARNDICGTIGFMAPETLLNNVVDISKVDVWGLASVVLERTIGPEKFARIWRNIDIGNISASRNLHVFEYVSINALDFVREEPHSILRFIQQGLVVDPTSRASFATIRLSQNSRLVSELSSQEHGGCVIHGNLSRTRQRSRSFRTLPALK